MWLSFPSPQNHKGKSKLEIETHQSERSGRQEEMTHIAPALVPDKDSIVILSSGEQRGEIKHNNSIKFLH